MPVCDIAYSGDVSGIEGAEFCPLADRNYSKQLTAQRPEWRELCLDKGAGD